MKSLPMANYFDCVKDLPKKTTKDDCEMVYSFELASVLRVSDESFHATLLTDPRSFERLVFPYQIMTKKIRRFAAAKAVTQNIRHAPGWL